MAERTRIRLDQSRQIANLLENVRGAAEIRQDAAAVVAGTKHPKITVAVDGVGQWPVHDDVLRQTLALWAQERVEDRYAKLVAALAARDIDVDETTTP